MHYGPWHATSTQITRSSHVDCSPYVATTVHLLSFLLISSCPGDAAGVLLSREELQRASAICAAAGAWLVVDNTYEHFTYGGAQHECVHGPHIINIFSFSKVRSSTRHRMQAPPQGTPCATASSGQVINERRWNWCAPEISVRLQTLNPEMLAELHGRRTE